MNTRKPFGISFVTALGAFALLLSLAPFARAQQGAAPQGQQAQSSQAGATFVGTWTLHMQPAAGRGRGARAGQGAGQGGENAAPPPSDNGSNNGGGNGDAAPNDNANAGGGRARQTLVIAADGDYLQITHSTPQGDVTSSVMPSGNSLSWTEDRKGPQGRTAKITYHVTVTGDSMNGTVSGPRGRIQRTFTATREQQ